MAENSKISWTDHTMNFWIGCTKVSEGCKFCYAENDTFARRSRANGKELWGPTAGRHRTSPALWHNLIKWNKKSEWIECTTCGWRGPWDPNFGEDCPDMDCSGHVIPTRQRVFCQSLSDICEIHPEILPAWHKEIAGLVKECQNIDFLFLTKRPENFNPIWLDLFDGKLPDNLWVGTSAENQERADQRIPELLKIKAKVRFLSCEPLLGPIDLMQSWMKSDYITPEEINEISKESIGFNDLIHWVIAGGESGSHARIMIPEWAYSLRDQCIMHGIPFHFKQWGEWTPDGALANGATPVIFNKGMTVPMWRIGKKAAGHLLEDKEWTQFPKVKRNN